MAIRSSRGESFDSWKRRRLATGASLSSIEAMRPKAPAVPLASNPFPQRETPIPGYMPPAQSFNYPQSPQASAPGEGFAPPGTSMSLNGDVLDMGEMSPGMQSQASSPFSTGGNPASPFESNPGIQGPPVAPVGSAAIPPGALANTPGFDPRFMKPKVPVWR